MWSMAEKIDGKDTLRKAYPKLNQMIDEVNDFQRQINEIVVEGDSSVEAAQARVSSTGTTYTTLKERLDKEHNEVSAHLAQTETELTNKLAQLDNIKIDGVVFDKNAFSVKFYANGVLVEAINISEAGNANAVQSYIDSLINDGLIEGVTLAKGSVSPEKTTFFEFVGIGKNKFDLDKVKVLVDTTVEPTRIYDTTGGVSWILPCKPNTAYTISRQVAGTRFRAGYLINELSDDHLENIIQDHTTNDTGNSVTLPPNPNAKYIACYFWRVVDQGEYTEQALQEIKFQVEIGDTVTPYEPLNKHYKIKNEFLPDNTIRDNKISILGDSISTFAGYIPSGNRSRYPQSNLLMDVNETWWMRLISGTGMTLGVNESWAGSRVSWDGVTEGQDVGAHKHMASDTRINNLGNNGAPDVIFFYGGTNDLGANVSLGDWDGSDLQSSNVDTFSDAYSTAIKKMQTAYPNAHIVCISPMYTTSYYPSDRLNAYADKIEYIANFYGCTFVDLRKCGITIYNRSTYLPDGIHPNAAGMELMYKYIMAQVSTILVA